eukprot:SAG22_NODE_792_length_7198_cov_1.752641_5_plen_191_part_00
MITAFKSMIVASSSCCCCWTAPACPRAAQFNHVHLPKQSSLGVITAFPCVSLPFLAVPLPSATTAIQSTHTVGDHIDSIKSHRRQRPRRQRPRCWQRHCAQTSGPCVPQDAKPGHQLGGKTQGELVSKNSVPDNAPRRAGREPHPRAQPAEPVLAARPLLHLQLELSHGPAGRQGIEQPGTDRRHGKAPS